MKIALIFCGQPRFVAECHESIRKHIIGPNNITDIFAHFWLPPEGLPYKYGTKDTLGSKAIESFLACYKPKKLTIEEQFSFPIAGWKRKDSNDANYDAAAEFNFKSYCGSRYIASFMGSNYDKMLVIRSDLLPTADIILPEGNDKQVFVKQGNKYRISDWVFGGSSNAILDLSHYQHLDQIYDKITQDGTQEIMHMALAQLLNIELVTCDWNMSLCQNYKEYGEDKRAFTL